MAVKILRGTYAPLSEQYSPELHKLLAALLRRKPDHRPTIDEVSGMIADYGHALLPRLAAPVTTAVLRPITSSLHLATPVDCRSWAWSMCADTCGGTVTTYSVPWSTASSPFSTHLTCSSWTLEQTVRQRRPQQRRRRGHPGQPRRLLLPLPRCVRGRQQHWETAAAAATQGNRWGPPKRGSPIVSVRWQGNFLRRHPLLLPVPLCQAHPAPALFHLPLPWQPLHHHLQLHMLWL